MTNRRTLLSFIFALALLLSACGGAATDAPSDASTGTETPTAAPTLTPTEEPAGLCDNIYFPVVEGAIWTYAGTGLSGPYDYTTTITSVTETGFTLSHAFSDLTATQEWTCSGEGIAALDYTSGPEAVVNTAGVTATFETTGSSGLSMPKDLAVGETWTQTYDLAGEMNVAGQTVTATGTVTHTYTAVREESMTTPVGTFTALVVEANSVFDLRGSMGIISMPFTFNSTTTNWWVAGLGMVKSTSLVTIEGSEPMDASTELQSYNIP